MSTYINEHRAVKMPIGVSLSLSQINDTNPDYFTYLVKSKNLIEGVKDKNKFKLLSTLLETDNYFIVMGIETSEDGLFPVAVIDVVKFLVSLKSFEFELLYAHLDLAILAINFNKEYSTSNINENWNNFYEEKVFSSFEIYMNYSDFIKLRGIGYDHIIEQFEERLNFRNQVHEYYLNDNL